MNLKYNYKLTNNNVIMNKLIFFLYIKLKTNLIGNLKKYISRF